MSTSTSAPPGRTSEPFRLKITGMDCGDCAVTIEESLRQLDGVEEARVNFTTQVLEGRSSLPNTVLRRRVEELGYGVAEPPAPDAAGESPDAGDARGFWRFLREQPHLRNAVALGMAVLLSMPLALLATRAAAEILVQAIRFAAILVVGYPIASRGIRGLLYARRITMDLLMAVAVVGAVAIGASGEATAVVLLFTLGEALEGYSAARSRASLQSLLALRPAEATLIRHGGAAHERVEQRVHVADLRPGDRVLIKPAERIAADGRIAQGASAIDEAAITGESAPAERGVGDEVFAGTVNGPGTLEIEVDRLATDFTIAEIARLVEHAQAQRSPAERWVDRFARWYTPAVVALAVLVATLPPLLLGAPFVTPDGSAPGWLYRGLALLIVACPCALVISIPVTVVSALTRLARLGILVKGGAQLDELAKVRAFAFDKTGTLTLGRPTVTATHSTACEHDEAETKPCEPCDDLLAMAASVERGSEHPFAHAIVTAANDRQLAHRYAPATDVTAHAGRGVSGTLNGRRITVGQRALLAPADDEPQTAQPGGANPRSMMWVGQDERILGYIEVEDALRESSREALHALKSIDPSYRFVMVTGDRRAVAEKTSARLGDMDEIHAELMPGEKSSNRATAPRRWSETASTMRRRSPAPPWAWRWAVPARIRQWRSPTWS
jgi:Cd2+/Zn2+-exporting ATPase